MDSAEPRITSASAQGDRPYQEDRYVAERVCEPNSSHATGWLLAVFDGHRGSATAEKASRAVMRSFQSALRTAEGKIPQAFIELFRRLEDLTRGDPSGSTASVVYIPEDAKQMYVAVLGDSPVASLNNEGLLHVAPEHNVRTNLFERAASEGRGALYDGGYIFDSALPESGLQMSRTLGDSDLARILNREPQLQTVALGGKGAVLVGTDGLLSPGSESAQEQMARLMAKVQAGADAQTLLADALDRHTGDNVTAIVWAKQRD